MQPTPNDAIHKMLILL